LIASSASPENGCVPGLRISFGGANTQSKMKPKPRVHE